MERVAAGGLGERMHEQAAGRRIAWDDHLLPCLEILLRLGVVTRRRSVGQGDEPWLAVAVAGNAARVARAFGQEDRLHARLEVVEVERRRLGRRRGGWRRGRRRGGLD